MKIQSTIDDISKIDQQVNDMKFASANKKDIQTFRFVAEQFGTTLDKVAKWFIFTLIFVFDPLAVALILAYNVVAYKEEKPIIQIEKDITPPTTTIIIPPSSENVVGNPIVNSIPPDETPQPVDPPKGEPSGTPQHPIPPNWL